MPIIERLDETYSMLESFSQGIEIDLSKFLQNLMIVGSYSVIQYALLIGGIILLFRFIKSRKYIIHDNWEYKIPRERVAGTVLLNVGTILFLIVSAILFVRSVVI